MRPAVFLDRDGTLIVDTHYPRDPDTVQLLPGVADALKELRDKGYLLFVVSNQSGVGRGIISLSEFQAVDARFQALLLSLGVLLDGVYYCTHGPDDRCACRKPAVGMVERTKELGVDRARSYCVGDKLSDLHLARNAGLRPVLVRTGKGSEASRHLPDPELPDAVIYPDLLSFAQAVPPT